MKKTLEKITVSTQVFPTVSSAISGSSVLGLDVFRHAVLRATAHRLPDDKGAGVGTFSLYETTNTVLNGQQVAASVVTVTLNSVTDAVAEVEISADGLTDTYTSVYPYFVGSTNSNIEMTVIRDEKRYET